MAREIYKGMFVRHFKGGIYKILHDCVYMHDTKERYVVYEQQSTLNVYIRPYDMFVSEVDHDKYPDVKQKYRFEQM